MTFEDFLTVELDNLGRYTRAMCATREEAEDVLADSLLKVHKNWPAVARADVPVAYVRRIITNTLVSQKRSWVTRTIFTTRSGRVPERAGPNPVAAVDDRDELDRLLLTLPAQQRAAVVLRYYLDRDDEAIAAELKCSVSAARSYISKALSTLRAPLDETEEGRRHG